MLISVLLELQFYLLLQILFVFQNKFLEYSSSLDPDSSNKVENYNRLIASNIFNIKDRLSAININSKTSLEDANLANGYLGYYDRIANRVFFQITSMV